MSSKNPSTRERILKTTWTLLESGGGNAVRMSDIAKSVGISRQALYLHFPSRAELLVATTRYLDEIKDVDARLLASRTAETGEARLDAFIEAWCSYIPEIYGVAKALMAIQETDDEARAAWSNRMAALRHGCEAAVRALARDEVLSHDLKENEATDLLWTLLSVRNWEHLTRDCGWSQDRYLEITRQLARQTLLTAE